MPPILTGFKIVFGAALGAPPTYSIIASTTSVNEGSSVTFTVTTTNIDNGTTLYWSTNQVSGTIDTSDFSDSATSGSFTINGGSGTITRTLSNDSATEGSESFQLQIRTGSTSGTIVATSETVTINDTSLAVFSATGGSKLNPGDGYVYHVFDSSSSFLVQSGSSQIEVLLQGGGGGGQSIGGSGSNSPGGAGGGGGATGVWSVPLTPGTYPVSVGGADGGSSLTNVNSTFIAAGGGGGSNSTPWPGASLTENYPGPSAPGRPGSFSGTPGNPAGGTPQPGSLWWRPYISPGGGGGGGSHGAPQSATPGQPYGGGGGGGAGSFDGGPGGVGRPGAPGRVVIRYQL